MRLDVTMDFRGLERTLGLMQKSVVSATAAALNDTANAVRANAVRTIAAETGMTQPSIRERLWIRRATRSGLIAEVGALPSARNVGKYKQARPRQQPDGVQLTAWGKRQTYQGTFVLGGKRNVRPDAPVLRRTGKEVTGKLYGPSVRQSFKRVRHDAVVRERFPVFFERRLRGALVRAGLNPDAARGAR